MTNDIEMTQAELEKIVGEPLDQLMTFEVSCLSLRPGHWPRQIVVRTNTGWRVYKHAVDDLSGDGELLGRRYRTSAFDELLIIND